MNFTGKIKCIKCQNEFGVRKDIYEKRIESHGGEENLLKSYLCRNCRSGNEPQATQKVNKQVQQKQKVVSTIPFINTLDHKPKQTMSEVVKSMYSTCIFPNRYLDNGRTCDTCDIFEDCTCTIKKRSKKFKELPYVKDNDTKKMMLNVNDKSNKIIKDKK